MDNMDRLLAASDAADKTTQQFHLDFDENVLQLMEPVRTALLESTESCTEAEIIGQLLMNFINNGGFTIDDHEATFEGRFNLRQKQNFMAVANHMGPDWTQALYHAAVFMTKVA